MAENLHFLFDSQLREVREDFWLAIVNLATQ
jgi:hypothetical protein